ncbi:hypothetical protein JOB18_030059 [Solea senegalensis]|uniref:Uncharacterized protein n=1 Tax=Solea senegalensis TaxID=28829 RepID=A0AAV6S1G3_SOLSE|nr:hypothetical protein JOB18_030059 [Solea senegalensis]
MPYQIKHYIETDANLQHLVKETKLALKEMFAEPDSGVGGTMVYPSLWRRKPVYFENDLFTKMLSFQQTKASQSSFFSSGFPVRPFNKLHRNLRGRLQFIKRIQRDAS